MDTNSLELLLNNNLTTIKAFVEVMFKSVREEVSSLKDENAELRHSLEFTQSEVESLKVTVRDQDSQLKFFHEKLEANTGVGERVRVLEDFSRSKNLRITGLPQLTRETSEQTRHTVQKLINEKLQLDDVLVKDAYRVGNSNTGSIPKQVIAKLESTGDKFKCIKNGKNLKGSNIYVNEDLSQATMQIRNSKLDELKNMRKAGFIAYFSGANIVNRGRSQAASNTDVLPVSPRTPQRSPDRSPVSPRTPQGSPDRSPVSPRTPQGIASTVDERSEDITSLEEAQTSPASPALVDMWNTSAAETSQAPQATRASQASRGNARGGATVPARGGATVPARGGAKARGGATAAMRGGAKAARGGTTVPTSGGREGARSRARK